MLHLEDTIVAIITPIGVGGISVLRLSGKQALTIADKAFRGKNALADVPSHTAHFGKIVSREGELIDEVVATVFKEPHSYTGENVVEVSCHGSLFVAQRILRLFIELGARHAEAGEFTKRAFLNGKIDLSQAEAIADLIQSRSALSHKASLTQLQGRLSSKVAELRDKLINLCGLEELELDFVEEGLEFLDKEKMSDEVKKVIQTITQLIDSYEFGKICRDGVKVVLTGKTNVGKSSLLNALLNEERAIVTEISGTTRDVIEENIIINGLLFKLIDTAGLRETNDIVEIEGIRRTRKEVENADIALFLVDASKNLDTEDRLSFTEVHNLRRTGSRNLLLVENKMDLINGETELNSIIVDEFGVPSVKISAKTGQGLDELRSKLYDLALRGSSYSVESSLIVTNSRHRDALAKARESLEMVLNGLKEGRSNEFLAIDIRNAVNSLGEIIGVVTTEDILNAIFSKFCIGK
jgi:tRNA modification GTPase